MPSRVERLKDGSESQPVDRSRRFEARLNACGRMHEPGEAVTGRNRRRGGEEAQHPERSGGRSPSRQSTRPSVDRSSQPAWADCRRVAIKRIDSVGRSATTLSFSTARPLLTANFIHEHHRPTRIFISRRRRPRIPSRGRRHDTVDAAPAIRTAVALSRRRATSERSCRRPSRRARKAAAAARKGSGTRSPSRRTGGPWLRQ